MATAPDARQQWINQTRVQWNNLHQHGANTWQTLWAFLVAFPTLAQGVYYVLTGIWPLVNIASFQAVTGPKTDIWLVDTLGILIFVIGCILCLAAYQRNKMPEVLLLAGASAAALAGVDIYFVMHDIISPVYLLDAFVEGMLMVLLLACWYAAATRPAAAVRS
jgi:hypothetical protein